ncbi:cytochrome P450 2J6-like isoform X2 [Patiria miniata]|uniref:Cytochrome P450 n=1 Tax=Patiria miniata TaxID=46514 RepID=A0A914AB09_PATMI|nr:cytochrome P450 2J6-like isoform X2 [Patiria miniata]
MKALYYVVRGRCHIKIEPMSVAIYAMMMGMFDATSLMGISTTTALIFVSVFLLVFWILRRHLSTRNLPPGPWAWPLLGNLPNLIAAGGGEAHEIFLRLSKKYGPVLRLDMVGGKRIIVLHGYEAISKAFSNPLLNDRPVSPISQSPGIGVITASGQGWKTQRNLVLRFMRDFSIGKSGFEGSIAQEVNTLIQEFKKTKGKPVKQEYLFCNALANIICSVVYGTRYDYNDPKFKELLHHTIRIFELLGSGGVLFFMPFVNVIARFIPSLREIIQHSKQYNIFVDEALLWHQADFDPHSAPTDFLYLCLNSKYWTQNKNLGMGHMMTTSGDLFFAGTETTASTLRWSLLYMMANPEIQARVQAEIDSVVGRDRLPQMSDKPNLPYTEATILEVQRISMILSLGVPHKAAEDTTLMGYTIPKGAILLPNFWALGRDPEVWHEPHLFKPERFLDKDGCVTRKDEFVPFSAGRRMCLGEPLAKMELFLFFTGLLHQFTFQRPDGAPPISFKSTAGFTFAPVPYEFCAIVRT